MGHPVVLKYYDFEALPVFDFWKVVNKYIDCSKKQSYFLVIRTDFNNLSEILCTN